MRPWHAPAFPGVRAQLLAELEPQDPASLRRFAPAHVSAAMLEAQVALMWATAEYRLGRANPAFKAAVQALTLEAVAGAVARFITDDRLTLVELGPRPAQQ